METITFHSQGLLISGAFFESAPRVGPAADRPPTASYPRSAAILCHGAFEDSRDWHETAAQLARQGCPTLVIDFTGHGESEGLPGLVSLSQWAYTIRDAMNNLEQRGFRRFALVGFDSGGSAALLAAAHDRRLVCVASLAAPVRTLPNVGERAAYLLASGASRVWKAVKKKPLTLSRVAEFDKLRFAADDRADAEYKANPRWRETLKAIPIPESLDSDWMDITLAVAKIKTPVLILHGQKDAIVPVRQAELLYRLLPGVKKLCLIENSGHVLHLDAQKEAVFNHIAQWVKHYLRD